MSATTPTTELEWFHQFVSQQIGGGGPELSPKEVLDLFRVQNPTTDEVTESVAAIKEVIADVDSGDVGRDATDVLSDLRKKHGIAL